MENGQLLYEQLYAELKDSKAVLLKLKQAIAFGKRKDIENANPESWSKDQGNICCLENVSLLSPRGKYNMLFGTDGLQLQGTKGLTSYYKDIQCVLKLPKRDAVQSNVVGEYLFVLYFATPIPARQGKSKCIAWQVKVKDTRTWKVEAFHANGKSKRINTKNTVNLMDDVLQFVLKPMNIVRTYPEIPISPNAFQSSDMQVYVKCYYKTSNGILYLLPEGLFFLSPMLFLPRDDILTITSGRDGAASSKTFDLFVGLQDKTKIEFTMIERQELYNISSFVSGFSKLKQNQTMQSSDDEDYDQISSSEDDDSDTEDEDHSPLQKQPRIS